MEILVQGSESWAFVQDHDRKGIRKDGRESLVSLFGKSCGRTYSVQDIRGGEGGGWEIHSLNSSSLALVFRFSRSTVTIFKGIAVLRLSVCHVGRFLLMRELLFSQGITHLGGGSVSAQGSQKYVGFESSISVAFAHRVHQRCFWVA